MDMYATLRRSGGIDALARHLGLSPAEGAAVARDLMPHVLPLFRRQFEAAGGGVRGLAALADWLAPFGGSGLALAILGPEPIAAVRHLQVAAGLLDGTDGAIGLVEAARRHSAVPARTLAAAVPLLLMLVGGYLAARAEAAGGIDADEIPELLAGGDPLRR